MTKATAGAGLLVWSGINSASTTLFNVPITVVAMAAAGALLSFAYNMEGDKEMSRKKLFLLVVANTFLSCALVAVVPQWLEWSWASPKIEGSLALLLAAVARFVIPVGLKAIPELAVEVLKKWFRLGDYKQDPKDKV